MKLHLRSSQQVLAGDDHRSLQRAYAQAISFHFKLAYVAFLQEMSADYQISSDQVDSFTQLEQGLQKLDIVCQECSMLAELECAASSWLSLMLRSYESSWPSEASASVKLEPAGHSLIQTSDVTEQHWNARYQHSYEQLYTLIQRYRELMQEW